jgi:hypothetical protein
LSGAGVHLPAINPPCGDLAPVSARCGRSTKNTESATIALAVIMKIACSRIPAIWAQVDCVPGPRNWTHAFVGGCPTCRPSMSATGMVSFCNTTAALPNHGVGRQDLAIPTNGFADRIECSAPTAVCLRTINAPWPTCCVQPFPCANRPRSEKFGCHCEAGIPADKPPHYEDVFPEQEVRRLAARCQGWNEPTRNSNRINLLSVTLRASKCPAFTFVSYD